MNKKLTYEQPSCDLFVIKVEEGFLVASPVAGQAGEKNTYNSYEEDF